jgi:WD40 repeat protein
MDLTPDGKALACAGQDEQERPVLAVLDTAKGALRWSARLPGGSISFLAVAPDGKAVGWAVGDTVHLRDLQTGRELRRFVAHKGPVRAGAFAPNGKLLVTAGGDDVRVWDARTGRELRRLDGHGEYSVRALAFAADGKRLASVGGDDFLVLWDTTTWRRARRISLADTWRSYLTFSPDGKVMAAGESSRTLSLWDAGTGKRKYGLVGHSGAIQAALFARDGKALVSVSEDGSALVWKWPSVVAEKVERPRPARMDALGAPLPSSAIARLGALWLRPPAW